MENFMLPTFDLFGLVAVLRPADGSLTLSSTLDLPDYAESARKMRAFHNELFSTVPASKRPSLRHYFAAEITALTRRPKLTVADQCKLGAACMGLLEESDDDNALIIDHGDRLDYVAIDGTVEEARALLSDAKIDIFLRKARKRTHRL